MFIAGNKDSSQWSVASGAHYALSSLIDNPLTRTAKGCVDATLTFGKDTVTGLVSPWLIGPALSIVKALGPHLEGKQDLLLSSIDVYDQLGLASEAIKLFHRFKKANPGAEFSELKNAVIAELGKIKSSKLAAAARAVYGPSVTDDDLLQKFFNSNVNEVVSENFKKQNKILDDTFKPLVAQLPGWVLVPSRWASIKMLDIYRNVMRGPAREASLVDQLSGLLYKGLSVKNEVVLPNVDASNQIKGSLEWQKLLREESKVSNTAEFICNVLSVASGDISQSIRNNLSVFDKVSPDNEQAAAIFDVVAKNINIGFLKLLNKAAGENIDDIRKNPAGKNSKSLPGNMIVNLSRLWDAHKEQISSQVSALRTSYLPEFLKKAKYQAIFKQLALDLVKMGGINPLEELDILSEEEKKKYWEEFQNTKLPHILCDLYCSLSQWEAQREANENKLASRLEHGVGAMQVCSRFIVESIQNYLVMNPSQIGSNVKNALVRKLESAKTTAGNKAVNYLNDKAHQNSFQSVIDENLPLLAKEDPLWDTVENIVQPTAMKLANDLVGKIGKIEEHEGSLFFRDTSLKLLELFAGHMKNINTVQFNAGMNNGADVNKCKMASESLKLKLEDMNSRTHGHQSLIDQEYISAKEKVYKAREKVENLNNVLLKAAKAYNSAKQWFGLGEGFFSNQADVAIRNVEVAKKELEIAEVEFSAQLKEKRGKPMALKMLTLFNIYAPEDLPLSDEQAALRSVIWEALVEDILPTMLENAVQTATNKNTINKILMGSLENFEKSINSLETKDSAEEGVIKRLDQIAHNATQYKESSQIAAQILAAAKGKSLAKAIRQVMAQNEHAVISMKQHFRIGCGALPHVRAKWEALLNNDVLEAENNIRQYHGSHGKEFDKACGTVIKEVVNMFFHRWASNVNIMKVHMINESAAESVGKLARENLEQYTMLNVMDMIMENAAPSLLPGGTWEANKGAGKGASQNFTKPAVLQKPGYTRDFNLPLSNEAKREWEIQQVLKDNETSSKVQSMMTSIFSYQTKGIFNSIVSTSWHTFIEWVYVTIDLLFAERAPRIRDALRTVISFCLEKLFTKSVQAALDTIKFVLDKPFTFLLENLYVSFKADRTIKWLQMDHVHDEFVWDALETIVNETSKKAVQVGA